MGEISDSEPAVLNLASRVRDEAPYHIPKTGEPPQAVVEGAAKPEDAAGNAQADGGPIDLNLASTSLLETLPGIGPATLNNIRDLVTVISLSSGSR